MTKMFSTERLTAHRNRVETMRRRARRLFEGGATGIQVTAALSEATDELLIDLIHEALRDATPAEEAKLAENTAVIAVGGSGRGELAPYSDVDLLFLDGGGQSVLGTRYSVLGTRYSVLGTQESALSTQYSLRRTQSPGAPAFFDLASQVVRDCWDAGLRLGHSVRTLRETMALARQEPHVATGLVETRLLWGDEKLYRRFRQTFERKVVHGWSPTGGGAQAFVEACLAAREAERREHGAAVSQLQPNLKRSPGGLRDIHLVKWIGFAHYETADIDSLRLKGALEKKDARRLLTAWEFLTRIRVSLHLQAGRPQDVLTYDEQLRIAEQRRIDAKSGQRPVERFMQQFFRHATDIANIAQRFAALHRPSSWGKRLFRSVFTHRVDGMFQVGSDWIDVLPSQRDRLLGSAEALLKLYYTAILNDVSPVPRLIEDVARAVPELPGELSPECARLFLRILEGGPRLGLVLRSLYETGLLEWIIPEMAHARCLLQFNEYHSYTVDEHTLRAVEAAVRFAQDDGPVGRAYREAHHTELLHLALLLHDLGKGYDEDHSEVGRRIARRVAARLSLPEPQREMLVFLVHKHLLMSHLALRRDIADPEILLQFSREVGSPELLRLLYVLTAADLIAVGPGVWTDWKSDLLTELYNRALLILSGEESRFREEEQIERVKEHVLASILPLEDLTLSDARGAASDETLGTAQNDMKKWIDAQIDAFSPHYLSATPPAQIAADLDVIRQLKPGELVLEAQSEPETDTVEYRLIAHPDVSEGCFHKVTGVLTAKRLEILSAQICTTREGYVVDSFRVVDRDFAGEVPQARIEDVAGTIRSVLTGETAVEPLFQRHTRFDTKAAAEPISDLPTRVVIDNDSSDRSTVIDIFAHDRPGLLYMLTRTINDLGLSVLLAKIGTHLDQVVDVFYVTDGGGNKIEHRERLQVIRNELTARIEQFEQQ